MVTGFDYLSQDKLLQEHWLKRFVAIVIDSLLIWVPLWILFTLLGASFVFSAFTYGGLLFLYSTIFDASAGGTVGKMLLHMKSVSVTGQLTLAQALMRNVSKVFGVLLLLDFIIGMAVDTRDPRQKWTDQMARTAVIVYDRPGGT